MRGDGPSGRRPSGIHAGVTSTGSTWLRQSAGVRAYLARMAAEMDRDQFLSLRRMRARWARSVGLQPAEDPLRLGAARRADRVQDARTVLGQLDQSGPPVTGVGPALDQAAGLEGVDDLRGGARSDVQMIRQLGQAQRPVALEHAQRPQLGRGDVPWGQALVGRLAQLARDRPERVRQRFVTGRVARAGRTAILGGHRNTIPAPGVVTSY